MIKKRCTCTLEKGTKACINCSRYKLVFLLKHGSDHLKKIDASGKASNPAIWSFIKEDHYPPHKIFKNMLLRFRNSAEYQHSNVIYFYERNGSTPLFTEKP